MTRRTGPPLDLAAMHRDDDLLDDLSAVPGDEVATLLGAWRRDVLNFSSSPFAGPALSAVGRAASGPVVRRISRRAAAAGVGTAIALASVGGVAAAAGSAGPHSRLWGITRVLHHAHAESAQARDDADRALAAARSAQARGDRAEAARDLTEAAERAQAVRDAEGHDALSEQVVSMRHRLAAPGKSAGSGRRSVVLSDAAPVRENSQQDAATPAATRAARPVTPSGSTPTSAAPVTTGVSGGSGAGDGSTSGSATTPVAPESSQPGGLPSSGSTSASPGGSGLGDPPPTSTGSGTQAATQAPPTDDSSAPQTETPISGRPLDGSAPSPTPAPQPTPRRFSAVAGQQSGADQPTQSGAGATTADPAPGSGSSRR